MFLSELNYRPSNSAIYYTPAQRIHLRRSVVGVALAILATTAGAFIYAKIQPTLMSTYTRAGLVVVAAVTVGLIGRRAVRYGKIRLPLVAAMIGGALSLVAM